VSERSSIAREELDKGASIARTLEHADALGALCYDVVGRQAEGRSLFAGEKFIAGRAELHGVRRQDAQTPVGNLLAALERGPDSGVQFALIAALFVRGFEKAVRGEPAQRKALVAKFAVHCDWLELCSPYRVLPLLSSGLDPELADEVQAELAELVLRDDVETAEPKMRAYNAGRIAALAEAQTLAARAALERIESTGRDVYSSTLAALALGKSMAGSAAPLCRVRGHLRRFPRGLLLTLLRWLSGWALLSWVLRLPLALLGCRREVEAELRGEAIRVRRSTFLLGRQVHSVEQVHPLGGLHSARRAARFPTLHLVLGAFCFALGVLLGGVFAFDASRTGDRALWLIAASLVLLGSGLDLVIEVLLPGGRGRVLLDLDFGRAYRTRLSGVPIEDADHFLGELWRRLSRTQGAARAVA
jgi:hypothetical protein